MGAGFNRIGTGRSSTDDDRKIAYARRLLADADDQRQLTITSVIDDGPFSTCYRGLSGNADAVLELLKGSALPLATETEFRRICRQRMAAQHLSFVRILHLVASDSGDAKHTFMESEFINTSEHLSKFLTGGSRLSLNDATLLLWRTAETLAQLHESCDHLSATRLETQWEWTVGLLTSQHVYFDQNAHRLRIPPFGISSFFWHKLGWSNYVKWVVPKGRFYEAPELNPADKPITFMTDQYMLGLLSLEILESRPLAKILNGRPPRELWMAPDKFVTGRWKDYHPQLWNIITTMLAEDPDQRWPSMRVAAKKFASVEKSFRAIAKYSYRATAPASDAGQFQLND